MNSIARTFILLSLSVGVLAQQTDSSFRGGMEVGCAQGMSAKGNRIEDTKSFCSCFADALVQDMSEEERQLVKSGDKNIQIKLIIRNADKLADCEKLAPSAKF